MKADLVVENGRIVTPDQTFAVAIKDGRIVAIGADDFLPEASGHRWQGQHVVPG